MQPVPACAELPSIRRGVSSSDSSISGFMSELGKLAWWGVIAMLAVAAGALPARAGDDPPGVKRVVTLKEMRERNVIIQKWDLSCGAAALATLLRYQHGVLVTERDIAATMLAGTNKQLVQQRMGFSLLDMKRFADALGLEGVGYGEVTLQDLAEMVPAIVPIRVAETFSHFVIVRGVVGDRVALADPAFGNRTLPVDKFEGMWDRKVAFIIQRRDGRKPPNRLTAGLDDYRVPAGGVLRNVVN